MAYLRDAGSSGTIYCSARCCSKFKIDIARQYYANQGHHNLFDQGKSVNHYQDILLFPIRDAESQGEFLIACVVMLTGFIIPNSTYQMLVMNAILAQAYAIASEKLEITSHATT
jgi:hypothetical protein